MKSRPKRRATQRSAVTNGSRMFLSAGVGNTEAARRYRDLLDATLTERGGPSVMTVTAVEACRTWAGLAVLREQFHARLALGETVDVEALGQLGDRMSRQERMMGKPLAQTRPGLLEQHTNARSRRP